MFLLLKDNDVIVLFLLWGWVYWKVYGLREVLFFGDDILGFEVIFLFVWF